MVMSPLVMVLPFGSAAVPSLETVSSSTSGAVSSVSIGWPSVSFTAGSLMMTEGAVILPVESIFPLSPDSGSVI